MDFDLLKKHPYATGTAVIVGGIVVFYLVSARQSSAPVNSGLGGNLTADVQLANAQAAAVIQTNAQQAQIQQAQLQAQVANTQTSAAVDTSHLQTLAGLVASLFGTQAAKDTTIATTQAQTEQQANQLVYAQNIQSLQDSVLTDQINQSTYQKQIEANTSLDALKATLDSHTQIALASLNDATSLASQDQANQYQLNQGILQYTASTGLANTPNRDNLNATTSILQTLATRGNPNVASVGLGSNSNSQQSGDAASASKWASVSSGISNIVTGLFG